MPIVKGWICENRIMPVERKHLAANGALPLSSRSPKASAPCARVAASFGKPLLQWV